MAYCSTINRRAGPNWFRCRRMVSTVSAQRSRACVVARESCASPTGAVAARVGRARGVGCSAPGQPPERGKRWMTVTMKAAVVPRRDRAIGSRSRGRRGRSRRDPVRWKLAMGLVLRGRARRGRREAGARAVARRGARCRRAGSTRSRESDRGGRGRARRTACWVTAVSTAVPAQAQNNARRPAATVVSSARCRARSSRRRSSRWSCTTLRGSIVGTRKELRRKAIAFAVEGKVKAHIHKAKLEDINRVFARPQGGPRRRPHRARPRLSAAGQATGLRCLGQWLKVDGQALPMDEASGLIATVKRR